MKFEMFLYKSRLGFLVRYKIEFNFAISKLLDYMFIVSNVYFFLNQFSLGVKFLHDLKYYKREDAYLLKKTHVGTPTHILKRIFLISDTK